MQYESGINRDAQKEVNLSLVIRALHAGRAETRIGLSRITGLKQATITKIVKQLRDWGLVTETTGQDAPLGRKPMGLTLSADRFFLGAARVNRSYLACGIFDIAGGLVAYDEVPNRPELGAVASLEKLRVLIESTLARSPGEVLGLGVALPGPYNARTKRITLMSGFPGWAKVDIEEGLSGLGLPIFLEHDANCGALAELWYGEHSRDENLLYVVCDRGVGAGLITNGQVYHGASGYAGEIGHASINFAGPLCECGNRGCLELYASSEALKEAYALNRLAEGGASPEAGEVLRLVRAGDKAAREAYRRVVGQLAFGVVGLINALNPDCVVFADRMVEGGDLFLTAVDSVFRSHLMPEVYASLRVSVNRLPGDPMLLGASVVALDSLLMKPTGAFSARKTPEGFSEQGKKPARA